MLTLILKCAVGVAGNTFSKLYAVKADDGIIPKLLYIFLVSVFSVFLYAAFGAFNLPVNGTTAIYALIYAALSAGNMFIQLLIYKKVNLIMFGLLVNFASLVLPSVYAFIFLGESFSGSFAVAASLILISVLLPIKDLKKEISKNKDGENNANASKGKTALIIISLILFVFIIAANSIVSKLVASDERVTNKFSFFTYTNVFVIGFTLIAFIPAAIKNRSTLQGYMRRFLGKNIIFALFSIVASAVSFTLSYTVLETMDLSLNQFASQAVSTVFITAVSYLVFKEGLTKTTAISVILSILSFVFLFFIKF